MTRNQPTAAKNIGIVATGDGDIVIDGDMNVSSDSTQLDGTNVGIVTTGDSRVVVNGAFNVGGNAASKDEKR